MRSLEKGQLAARNLVEILLPSPSSQSRNLAKVLVPIITHVINLSVTSLPQHLENFQDHPSSQEE